jgi:hypothetical protein
MSRTMRAMWSTGLAIVLTSLLALPAEAAGSFAIRDADLEFRGAAVQVTTAIACDPMPPNSWASVGLAFYQGKFGTYRFVQGFGNYGAVGFYGLDCDGSVHTYGFEVLPFGAFADRIFRPGPVRFEAVVQICTLVDPVAQDYHCVAPDGTVTGTVRIHA